MELKKQELDVDYQLENMPNGDFVGEVYHLTHQVIKDLGGDYEDNDAFIKAETTLREYTWKACQRALLSNKETDERTLQMKTVEDAIQQMNNAYYRLKELGWNDPSYCPKDGTLFDSITIGTSLIADCFYSGEWPNGYYIQPFDGDAYIACPTLFKLKPN